MAFNQPQFAQQSQFAQQPHGNQMPGYMQQSGNGGNDAMIGILISGFNARLEQLERKFEAFTLQSQAAPAAPKKRSSAKKAAVLDATGNTIVDAGASAPKKHPVTIQTKFEYMLIHVEDLFKVFYFGSNNYRMQTWQGEVPLIPEFKTIVEGLTTKKGALVFAPGTNVDQKTFALKMAYTLWKDDRFKSYKLNEWIPNVYKFYVERNIVNEEAIKAFAASKSTDAKAGGGVATFDSEPEIDIRPQSVIMPMGVINGNNANADSLGSGRSTPASISAFKPVYNVPNEQQQAPLFNTTQLPMFQPPQQPQLNVTPQTFNQGTPMFNPQHQIPLPSQQGSGLFGVRQ